MKRSVQRIVIAAVIALAVTLGMASSASASESRSGYRECASRIVVNSQTAALNAYVRVRHQVTYGGYTYYSPWKYSGGFYSTMFGVPAGSWQAYVSNGTMSSGYATCG